MAWRTSCTSPDRQLGPGVLDPYSRLAEDAKGEGSGHVCDRRKRNESAEKGPLHARYTLNLSQPRLSQNFPTHVTACDGTPMKGSVTAHPRPHRATFKTSRYDCLSCSAWPLLTRRRRDTKSKESGLSFVLSRHFCRPELAYQAFFY